MASEHLVTELTRDAELEINRALRSIRFGSIEISIQDSRIVQIECKEKLRIEGNRSTTDTRKKAA